MHNAYLGVLCSPVCTTSQPPPPPPRRPGQSTASAHALHGLTLAMAFAGRAAVPAAGHTGRRGGPVGAGPARRHGCGHGAARGLPGRGAAADAAAAPGHRRQPAGGRPGAILLQGQRTACILCSGPAWSWWRSWRNVYYCGPQRSLSRGGHTHPHLGPARALLQAEAALALCRWSAAGSTPRAAAAAC